ncbi:hypothetical protein Fmac_027173 [Flemingia macrophylla]|uniref:CHAD domain-containing protein n=1 Tax=Flemingia macrophylla TaxID=520843 RepID=A0ABD1LH07_9FABA
MGSESEYLGSVKAQYALLLSGTLALFRPIELFKQGFFGVYQGASNHEELHNLMKATVMIRRLKKDVISQLPVKRKQQVFLDLADKDMKQINALFREGFFGVYQGASNHEELHNLMKATVMIRRLKKDVISQLPVFLDLADKDMKQINALFREGFFGVYQGASNHEELHNLMKATVMIRRLKKDVISQLPVKRKQQVFLDLADKDMKQINALFREGFFGVYQGASNHEKLHNLMKATVMIRRLKNDVISQLPVKRKQQVFLDLADKDMKKINALFREHA